MRIGTKQAVLRPRPRLGQNELECTQDHDLEITRLLRSAESMTVAVPRTLSSLGDRSFATAGPRAWNKLPPHLRLMQSADTQTRTGGVLGAVPSAAV